jgi:hypothetical protein
VSRRALITRVRRDAAQSRRPNIKIQEKTLRENAMELLIGFAFLATVWIIVLWGSRYFGPKSG